MGESEEGGKDRGEPTNLWLVGILSPMSVLILYLPLELVSEVDFFRSAMGFFFDQVVSFDTLFSGIIYITYLVSMISLVVDIRSIGSKKLGGVGGITVLSHGFVLVTFTGVLRTENQGIFGIWILIPSVGFSIGMLGVYIVARRRILTRKKNGRQGLPREG